MTQKKLIRSTLLSPLRQMWGYVLVEPCRWLFLCFFQPMRFSMELEHQGFWKRFILMSRLVVPLFILAYPFAVAIRLLLSGCFLSCNFSANYSIGINLLLLVAQSAALGIACGIVAGVLGDIGLGIVLSASLGVTGITPGNMEIGFARGLAVAIALGTIGATAKGLRWGIKGGLLGGFVGGLGWGIAWSLARETRTGLRDGLLIAAIFFASYFLGYYRLLLYPISCASAFWAYRASRKNPLQVFAHLRNSSLHWDECVFLPLPHLQRTLFIAVEQDVPLALKEIAFIMDERPQQRPAALRVSLEIALRDLQMRESIRDIARAVGRLGEILPQETTTADARWITPLTRLADASREAARYCGPLSMQARRLALEEMLNHLDRIYPDTAFFETSLKTLLEKVVTKWRAVARYEQDKLEEGSEKVGQIDNPYNPGQVLKPHDPLFVGRRDIVRRLSESLSSGRHRPTFLLNGERRMGKSSTLKQLPNLLGSSYIPIVFDLQARGISSSIDVFLGRIAEEIYKAASLRGMLIEKLERTQLREATHRNDAAAYFLFDEWLDKLEVTLGHEDRTVMLLFDEFEKLEETGFAGYLNLNLLLDWFRSTVQNRSHLVLLFSGVRTFSDMGANWTGYFVNARALRVSFLQPAEALHLILHPTPHFSGQEIFGEEVVEEIIRVTGCHPFLIQAICSELIEHLNSENSMHAELQDVNLAATLVLENWWDTYFRDLWERSDQQQRTCLAYLSQVQEANFTSIAQQSGLDTQMVRQTLLRLLERDLVLSEKGTYRIAVPLFNGWVERSI